MEIHRFEKLWLAVSIVLIVAFIGTVTYGAVGVGVQMVDESGGTTDADAIKNNNFEEAPNFREPGVYQTGENRYEIYVVAQQFLFRPGTQSPIRVPAGSTVTLYVTSADVIHGFQLAGTNINTMVVPGQVTKITAQFEEPDQYGLICHEYCGAGHHNMAGQMVVVEDTQGQLNATSMEGR